MELTKRQIALLKNLQRNRQTAPTFLSVLQRFPRWIVLAFAIGVAFGLFAVLTDGSPRFGCYLLGFISGALYVLYSRLSAGLRSWPLTREITDWRRVEELIEQNENKGG